MPLTGRGNGPGGVPDCVGWWKPESLTGANGSAISSWADSSPNALHATQATAAKQPTLVAAALNGYPAASFDGSDDILFLDATAAGPIARNIGGITIVAVAATSATDTAAHRLVSISNGGATSANRATLSRQGDFAQTGGRRLDGDGFQAVNAAAGTTPLNTYRVLTNSLEYSAAVARIFVNGTQSVSATFQTAGNTSDTNSVGVSIGAQPSSTLFWTGPAVEIAVFDRTLTDAERASVHSYFQDKFGIAVSDYVATAALSSTGSLAATATPSATRAAALSSTGSLSTSISPALTATPLLSSTGSLSAASIPATTTTAALSGTGALTATVAAGEAIAAALSGTGTLSATQFAATIAAVAMSGTGTLTAALPVNLPPLTGAVLAAFNSDGVGTAAFTSDGTGVGTFA